MIFKKSHLIYNLILLRLEGSQTLVKVLHFTNKKSDKRPYTTIRQIYKNGDPILDNWTCYDCSHSGQGTSSDNYGASARNLDFIMNKSNQTDSSVKPYFI